MGCSFGRDTESQQPKKENHAQKEHVDQKQPVHVPTKKNDVHPPPVPIDTGDNHVHLDKYGNLVDNATGGRVFLDAEKLRNEADRFAKLMVQHAKEAHDAHEQKNFNRAHDAKLAKEEAKKQMDSCNAKAVHAIVDPQKWRETRKLDLHGLHVQEAKAELLALLTFFRGQGGEAEIITGAGHHSVGHNAKIKPAVIEVLKEKRLQFESEHGDGAFIVHF